jgi:DNA-binding beta-propeller fold protein YncE
MSPLSLALLLTGLSLTSILQFSQTVDSQRDYEELIITEPNNDQKLIQPSGFSKIGSVEEQQQVQYTFFSEWGSSGTDNGQFQLPWSLTLDSSGNVYVVDRNNARIQKFDPNGNFIVKWSMANLSPVGIASDSLDNIYVTAIDNGANVVTKFSNQGMFITRWTVAGPNPQVDTQNAIAIDTANNVYVSSNNRVFKYTNDGQFLSSWGSSGINQGEFNQIVGLATDSMNNVYVVEKYNFRIQKFTSDGSFVTSWGADCQSHQVFCSEPQGIAIDPMSNTVYVTEYNAGRVSVFTEEGQFLTGFNSPSAYGIAVNSDNPGRILVYVSSGSNKILVYQALTSNNPEDAIRQLINDIKNNPEINDRIKASLVRILDLTLRLLTDDNPRNDIAICILLNGELRIIDTYERIRHLDSNTAEQLKTQINNIKNSLGC